VTSRLQTPRSDSPALVGLDLGTTRVKSLIIDSTGQELARSEVLTPSVHPRPGWTDYDPEDLWQAACTVIRSAAAQLDNPARVRGIAVASVAESAVPLDARGQPLDRAIAWFDLRTADEYQALVLQVGRERLSELSGLKPDPIFGLCKLLWFRNHRWEEFSRMKTWLNLAEFIAYRLSGVIATDHSLACRTMAYNLYSNCWDEALLDAVHLAPDLFGKLQASGTALNTLTLDAAAATGLSPEVIVGVGGHDHIVGAFGSGSLREGIVLDSLGTSEALLLTLDRPLRGHDTMSNGLSQGLLTVDRPYYYLVGGLYSSGGTIEWFRNTLADQHDRSQLSAEAFAAAPGRAIFLPHLSRSLTPHPDDLARGAFIGLTTSTTAADMYRAILEGLAFEARAALEEMVRIAGRPTPKIIRVIGHNSGNAPMMRLKASVYGKELEISPFAEATSFGAALLAGLAAGIFKDVGTALQCVPGSRLRSSPDENQARFYDELYRGCYQGLYESLRSVHHRLVGLPQIANRG
jgi:xylulokinase